MDLDAIHELASEPEYATVEDFVQFCMDDERETFTHLDLRALALNARKSGSKIREELEGYGLTLSERKAPKTARGFGSWDNNRWAGNPCGGGSGWEQINGFAGQEG